MQSEAFVTTQKEKVTVSKRMLPKQKKKKKKEHVFDPDAKTVENL